MLKRWAMDERYEIIENINELYNELLIVLNEKMEEVYVSTFNDMEDLEDIESLFTGMLNNLKT